jgi:hypothetical protein
MTILLPILTLAAIFVAFYFAFEYSSISSKYKKLVESQDKLKNADYVHRKAEKILESAQDRYQEIIDASYQKAEKILKEAKVFNDATRDQVLEELGNSIKNISQEIKREAMDEVKDFGNQLQQEVAQTQKAAEETVSKDYDKVALEVQNYKQTKMAEIDEEARKMIREVVTNYLGHALSLKDQEEILIKALTDAKQQHKF